MSTSPPPGPSDAIVADAIVAERSAVVGDLGSRPTIWLAVAPLWTMTVAEAVGFPVDSVTDFVTRARRIGWCETRGSLLSRGPGELRFWVPDQTRRDVIEVLSRLVGSVQLRQEAARIAALVVAHPDPDGMPGTLRDWAGLMTDSLPEAALVARVRRAVEAGDLSGAQQLVSAGQAMAPLLSGAAELAVDRARRLLNLGIRRRRDSRALDRYLDRPALSDAVSALLRPDAAPESTGQWALHLRGVGGVGKTMLIRYLASGRYAADRDMDIVPVVRADFDHISADYPVRRPVQLLLELADELALHTAGSTAADRALSSFRATATSAHEALSGQREISAQPFENPLVRRAIEAFGQVLERVPGVLLILDTCEELAKADGGDPAAPAVRATFGIIELLHEMAPATRVLLAGRRALPSHDYLAVTEVTGFTADEATRYLTTFADRPLQPSLRDAIIRQSALSDGVSPFDLALYLSWADEDPDLDEQRIAAGSDAYVEGRIIARLGDPLVLEALPVLAALGRSRVDTVEALVPGNAGTLGARLAEQEWVDADGDPPVHLTVQPVLARRLRHYFEAPARQAEFTATTARLAGALRERLTESPLAETDVDELLAALRLSEPAAAADLWDDVVRRAQAPPGRWGWVLNVADRVLGESGEDEECWPTADALLATVTAAWIAGRRRAHRSFDPTESWHLVRASAGQHPDPDGAEVLRARAALGLLGRRADREALWPDLRSAPQVPALAAAAVDAKERLIEDGNLRLIVGHLAAAQQGVAGARVQAWAYVLHGRLSTGQAAFDAMATAERIAAAAPEEPSWADWIPPEDLLARIRIERGLLGRPDADTSATWESYAATDLSGIDRERLASLCLRLRLGEGTLNRAEIERWEALDVYRPGRMPACSAHDVIPPLFVTLAEAELAAGRPERALDLVEAKRVQALSARREQADDPTLLAADAETVRLARRFRLDDRRALLARLADPPQIEPSRFELQDAARRAMAVVYSEQPFRDRSRPAGWHACWQCLTAPVSGPHDLLRVLRSLDRPTDAEHADLELDLEEMSLLSDPALASLERELAGWLAQPEREPAPVRSADPYHDARVALRRHVLTDQPYQPPPGVPIRSVAEMAFDEAELLALRLPDRAARLYRITADAYDRLPDTTGRLMAMASLALITGERWEFRDALADVRHTHPDVAARLTGPLDVAGPWRYWASLIQQLTFPEISLPNPAPGSAPPAPGSAPPAPGSAPAPDDAPAPEPAPAVGTLRPGWLRFTARISVSSDGHTMVTLLVDPKWRRPRKARFDGYAAAGTTDLSWTTSPAASDRWWRRRRRTPSGVIELERESAAHPWERILTASLGPGAVGRVEWVRHLATAAVPYESGRATEVWVETPSAWGGLRRLYEPATGLAFRHAVGRAVITSAGPRFDVSGEAAASAKTPELLDVERLVGGRPALVVLQAEPTDQAVDSGLQDDLPERLTLAADLIEAGAPAVLLVPALPAALLPVVAGTIAAQDGNARPLLTRLRRELGPRVEPAVLDDIVLFINPRGEQ